MYLLHDKLRVISKSTATRSRHPQVEKTSQMPRMHLAFFPLFSRQIVFFFTILIDCRQGSNILVLSVICDRLHGIMKCSLPNLFTSGALKFLIDH